MGKLRKLELQMFWNNAKINVVLGIVNNSEQLKIIAEAVWEEKYSVNDFSG